MFSKNVHNEGNNPVGIVLQGTNHSAVEFLRVLKFVTRLVLHIWVKKSRLILEGNLDSNRV